MRRLRTKRRAFTIQLHDARTERVWGLWCPTCEEFMMVQQVDTDGIAIMVRMMRSTEAGVAYDQIKNSICFGQTIRTHTTPLEPRSYIRLRP